MILFLLFQLLEEAASSTRLDRSLRDLVSRLACESIERHDSFSKKLKSANALVAVPCYNEELALPELLKEAKNIHQMHPEIVFLFVDDGSKDQTFQILKDNDRPHLYARHGVNIGVSGVLQTAFKIALEYKIEHVIQFDGDGQHPAEKIPELVSVAKNKRVDLLIGSRFSPRIEKLSKNIKSTTQARILAIQMISIFLKIFTFRSRIHDPTSGFRVYSKKAISKLISALPDEFPEPESIALLSLDKQSILEIPVEMKKRTTGVSSLAGMKSVRFMLKVLSALIGLRLRS
jgi:glycosyltransferase involved in cell wall biosynthesis